MGSVGLLECYIAPTVISERGAFFRALESGEFVIPELLAHSTRPGQHLRPLDGCRNGIREGVPG